MTIVRAYANFSGKRANGTTVSGIIPQFDGSAHAGANCGCASEAMRLVSQQKGRRPSKGSPWQPTGASIRRETGDTSGGTNPGQTTRASQAEYGIPHAAPRISAFNNLIGYLNGGFAVDLLVGYGPINRYKSGSPGFTGNHRIVLVGRDTERRLLLSADPLYDGRRSGIPLGPQWIPQSVLFEAAGALVLDPATHRTVVDGQAYFIPSLTNLEPPPVTLRVKVTCDTAARRGASRDSEKLGDLGSGDILAVTATSEGGHWSGCDKEGTKWRRFIAVNGKSTLSKWDRAYAYCPSGLTRAV